MGNKKLHQVNKAKQDKFYTQMTDIEKGDGVNVIYTLFY